MPSIKEKGSRPAKPQLDPLRKLSFGAITRKQDNAKTAYPVLPDPNGQLAIITARIIERTAQIEALDGALAIDKSELKTLATPFYFTQASGKVDVASSVSAVSPAGEVLITFPNRYGRLESEAALLPILRVRTSTFSRRGQRQVLRIGAGGAGQVGAWPQHGTRVASPELCFCRSLDFG